MGIGAKEAAELTGMSKAGILKAIRSGKMTASKDLSGAWEIDPAELFRVYPALPTGADKVRIASTPDQGELLRTTVVLQREIIDSQKETIRILEKQVDELRARDVRLLEDKQAKGFWTRLLGK